MGFLIGLGVILVGFISLFSFFIQSKKLNFKDKKRWLQGELLINIVITLILIIINGLGMSTCFILFWLIFSFLFYYIYIQNKEKLGFIGVTFCSFFLMVFLFLQVSIYGTGI